MKTNNRIFCVFVPIIICIAVIIGMTVNVSAAVYTVRQDGTGDFLSIQQAVSACVSGDTINIGSGTYKESVIVTGKTVNLIGAGKDSCIITYPTSNYMAVPLFIQSGIVKNMTIKGYGSTNGYVVHIDNPYQYGRKLIFENCNIISEGSKDCLGIGTYGGNSIIFNNCTLKSDGEVLFYHNSDKNDYPGKSSISFNGCNIKSPSASYIRKVIFPTNNTVSLNMNNTSKPNNSVSDTPVPDISANPVIGTTPVITVPSISNGGSGSSQTQGTGSTYGSYHLDENGYIIF